MDEIPRGIPGYDGQREPVYLPKVWGPHYWFFLNTIALTYPKWPNATTKKQYYTFFRTFSLFIPVAEIAKEFDALLIKYPIVPYLDDRRALVKWVHFIHNQINRKLERPEISLREFLARYYYQYVPEVEKTRARYSVWQKVGAGVFVVACVILAWVFLGKN
jgi:hypothetical protein